MHRFGLWLAAAGLVLAGGAALAQNADTVDLMHASATPVANRLLALDGAKHFPSSVWGVPFTLNGATPGAVLKGFNYSTAANSSGVCGYSFAILGATRGVVGASESTSGIGVYGTATATSGANYGVYGSTASDSGYGGYFRGGWFGVFAKTDVTGASGIVGQCDDGSNAWGVGGASVSGYAGHFGGKVHVTGDLTVGGTKSFKIDHPLDPEGMYLYHSCVESSERMNVYSGNAILDARGEAWVELPDWFEALNCDFRYQLTPIGAPAPNLYIAQKVRDGYFGIAGGLPGMEVCWMVTGVRQDAYALAHPMLVEVEKSEVERGYYIHPELYGQPGTMSIEWATKPELMMELAKGR